MQRIRINLFREAFTRAAKMSSFTTTQHVPVEYHNLIHSPTPWKVVPEGFRMVVVNSETSKSLRQSTKEYMLRTFYQEAPIPLVLGLNERINKNCDVTHRYLENEINAHLDSGMSSVLYDNENLDEIVGGGFCRIWEKNTNYNIDFTMDVKAWHNFAAENVADKDNINRVLDWRSLQSLHIYNLGQKLLNKSSKKYSFYLAMLHISPCAQAKGLSSMNVINTMLKDFDLSECLIYCQSNFPGFDKVIYKLLPNPEIVDQVMYKDEELVINGERVFQKISHLEGLKFFVEFFNEPRLNSEP